MGFMISYNLSTFNKKYFCFLNYQRLAKSKVINLFLKKNILIKIIEDKKTNFRLIYFLIYQLFFLYSSY